MAPHDPALGSGLRAPQHADGASAHPPVYAPPPRRRRRRMTMLLELGEADGAMDGGADDSSQSATDGQSDSDADDASPTTADGGSALPTSAPTASPTTASTADGESDGDMATTTTTTKSDPSEDSAETTTAPEPTAATETATGTTTTTSATGSAGSDGDTTTTTTDATTGATSSDGEGGGTGSAVLMAASLRGRHAAPAHDVAAARTPTAGASPPPHAESTLGAPPPPHAESTLGAPPPPRRTAEVAFPTSVERAKSSGAQYAPSALQVARDRALNVARAKARERAKRGHMSRPRGKFVLDDEVHSQPHPTAQPADLYGGGFGFFGARPVSACSPGHSWRTRISPSRPLLFRRQGDAGAQLPVSARGAQDQPDCRQVRVVHVAAGAHTSSMRLPWEPHAHYTDLMHRARVPDGECLLRAVLE